jgi:hypothetical protein
MFKVHCHVHESAVLLDWSRVERMYDSDEGPVVDWTCWCGARGRLIAGMRSEPRVVEPVVVDLLHTARPTDADDRDLDGRGANAGGVDGRDLDAVST